METTSWLHQQSLLICNVSELQVKQNFSESEKFDFVDVPIILTHWVEVDLSVSVTHLDRLLIWRTQDIIGNEAFLPSVVPHFPPLLWFVQQLRVDTTKKPGHWLRQRRREQKKSCWFILMLTSTISPFLTVSSLSFLERKSAVTLMGFGCDSPKLKNTSQGIKNLWGSKPSLLTELYVMCLCIPWFSGGLLWSRLGWSLRRKNTRPCYVCSSFCSAYYLSIWTGEFFWYGLPGWVQVVDSAVCSQLLWVQVVQVLQTLQRAASHQRTPECTSGCPHRLRATGCW